MATKVDIVRSLSTLTLVLILYKADIESLVEQLETKADQSSLTTIIESLENKVEKQGIELIVERLNNKIDSEEFVEVVNTVSQQRDNFVTLSNET